MHVSRMASRVSGVVFGPQPFFFKRLFFSWTNSCSGCEKKDLQKRKFFIFNSLFPRKKLGCGQKQSKDEQNVRKGRVNYSPLSVRFRHLLFYLPWITIGWRKTTSPGPIPENTFMCIYSMCVCVCMFLFFLETFFFDDNNNK